MMSAAYRTAGRRAPSGLWRASALIALAALVGCGEETADPDPVVTPPVDGGAPPVGDRGPTPADAAPDAAGWIELGGGARTFEALEPGEEVPIIAGIQGGFHVWGGFRGAGFDDSDVRLRFWLDLAGQTVARADYSEFGLPPDRRDASVFDYAGVAVVYDRNEQVQLTSGQTMTLRVEVESLADGQVMTDTIEVVPVCCE